MSELAAVIAIDGGNSKTDVALIAADGSLLAAERGTGSNYQGIGKDGMVAVLTDLVRAAADQAGLAGRQHVAGHTSACLAGADLPEEEADLNALVQSLGWSATTSVVNDTFAVLRAGLDDAVADEISPGGASEPGASQAGASQHWGIGLVCGAGINCVGVAPDGRTTRFPALGRISGDWGGGGELASEAMWWAIRAEDGRGPQTALRTAVPAHFGLHRVEDVVAGVHFGKIPYAELYGLAPVMFELANRGDQVARDVLLRQAEEICLMVTAAARRLGLGDGGHPVPVVLGGSLMAAKDPILTGAIAEQVTNMLPGADIRIVDVPPVVGAALLGLDHVGAPASAAARLRDCARATW